MCEAIVVALKLLDGEQTIDIANTGLYRHTHTHTHYLDIVCVVCEMTRRAYGVYSVFFFIYVHRHWGGGTPEELYGTGRGGQRREIDSNHRRHRDRGGWLLTNPAGSLV